VVTGGGTRGLHPVLQYFTRMIDNGLRLNAYETFELVQALYERRKDKDKDLLLGTGPNAEKKKQKIVLNHHKHCKKTITSWMESCSLTISDEVVEYVATKDPELSQFVQKGAPILFKATVVNPVKIYLGKSFTISVKVKGGLGDFAFQWYRDSSSGDQVLEDNQRIQGAKTSRLVVTSAKLSDRGIYYLKAASGTQSATCPLIPIDVDPNLPREKTTTNNNSTAQQPTSPRGGESQQQQQQQQRKKPHTTNTLIVTPPPGVPKDKLCSLCNTCYADCIVLDCGHDYYCSNCVSRKTKCPACGEKVKKFKIKVNLDELPPAPTEADAESNLPSVQAISAFHDATAPTTIAATSN